MSAQPDITASGRKGPALEVRTWLLLGVGVVCLAGLGILAYIVRGADDLPGELTVSLWVQSWRAPWLDSLMNAISAPGFRTLSLPLLGVVLAALYVSGRRGMSGLVLAVTLLTGGVNSVIRNVVDRPRPSDDMLETFADLGGFSFPSGHVMHYVMFFGTLVFVLTENMRSGTARWLVYGGLVLWLAAAGVSKIYLGAHWLSDVLAGYAPSAVMLAAVMVVWRHRARWVRRLKYRRAPYAGRAKLDAE